MALQELPLAKIRPAEGQPRKTFYQESLEELAASIAERGVLEPIVVRPMPNQPGLFEIIMGERRFRASRLAGKETIPAIVRDLSDEDAAADALLENFQREDLNPVEKARAVEGLLQFMSYEKVCKTLGVSDSTLRRLLELLELPPHIQAELVARPGGTQIVFSEGHARALLPLNGEPAIQMRLVNKIKAEKMSAGSVEHLVAAMRKHPEKTEVFLHVSSSVADQMMRSMNAAEDKKKPYKSQTAKEHLRALDRAAWQLTDLLDERVVDFLSPEEMNHLLAISAQATRQMEVFNNKIRMALENRTFGFREVYIHCPLCGRIELVGAVRCSTCWTLLRRCIDCGNYSRPTERCTAYGKAVTLDDAEAPTDNSMSVRCPDYKPKFTPQGVKLKVNS